MNLQDATKRVRRAIEVITPEFKLPISSVKVNEGAPGLFNVILTDEDYLAPINDVTVRHVLGAQIGVITHELVPRAAIETSDDSRRAAQEVLEDPTAVQPFVNRARALK